MDVSLNFLSSNLVSTLISALPPQIKELNLSFNRLRDEGVSQLSESLKHNYSLVSLNLQETEFSNLN